LSSKIFLLFKKIELYWNCRIKALLETLTIISSNMDYRRAVSFKLLAYPLDPHLCRDDSAEGERDDIKCGFNLITFNPASEEQKNETKFVTSRSGDHNCI
jgi:hypothetical protein